MIAFVLDVIRFTISEGSNPNVDSSISAKTGFELTNNVELAVEINEKDGTITSSP